MLLSQNGLDVKLALQRLIVAVIRELDCKLPFGHRRMNVQNPTHFANIGANGFPLRHVEISAMLRSP